MRVPPLGTLLVRRLVATGLTGAVIVSVAGLDMGRGSLSAAALAQAAPDAPPAVMSGGALPPLPDAETPTVARDVGVAELPLLVTEPPASEPEVEIPAPVTGGADSTFNPFAPLLVPQPETAPAPPTPVPPVVTEQPQPPPTTPAATASTPPAPARAAPPPTVVPAPAPQARLSTPSLPATLGARMQPSVAPSTPTTRILDRTLGGGVTTPNPLAETAAIRVPASPTPAASAPGGTLTPVGLANDGKFTLASSNRVSRSLRDLRVDFTAMATGTGVFRVGNSERPILLRVGEPLPGTRLVLRRLTRSSAQFSEDDARHTLLLSP